MSSSTERKNRQLARENGTDRKTIAEREEAAKKRKDKIKWTIIGVAIAAFVVAVIYLNSGLFYRNSTAVTVDNTALEAYNIKAGSEDYSVAEVNYVYNSQLMQILSYFGDYASYMGLDVSQPLDKQPCSLGGETEEGSEDVYTWDDYFMEAAYSHLKELSALCAYAEYAGISLDDEDMQTIEDTFGTIKDAAEQNGYKSVNKFLSANYGTGCNTALVRGILEKEAIAAKVQSTISEGFEYTDAQIKEKYASVADSYDTFDYDYYYVEAETETDENGAAVASDEALAAAKASADEILAAINGGDSFADAVVNVIGQVENIVTNEDGTTSTEMQDAAPTNGEDVAGSELPSAISEWMLGDRAANDCDIIESDTGYYVVKFYERDNNRHTTEESGDMLACDYIADGLLRNDDLSAWLDDVIAGIEEIYSTSDHFAIKYVGR